MKDHYLRTFLRENPYLQSLCPFFNTRTYTCIKILKHTVLFLEPGAVWGCFHHPTLRALLACVHSWVNVNTDQDSKEANVFFKSNDLVVFAVNNGKKRDLLLASPLGKKKWGKRPWFPTSNPPCMGSTSSSLKVPSGWPQLSQRFHKPLLPSCGLYSIYMRLLEKNGENKKKMLQATKQ